MKYMYIIMLICMLSLSSCTETRQPISKEQVSPKIQLRDYASIDEDGLRGGVDSKVSVGYQFVIPNTDKHKEEVKSIDPTIRFVGSPSLFCKSNLELLCIGNTYKKDYRRILRKLAQLSYVTSINDQWLE
jgi:hypothetical protein